MWYFGIATIYHTYKSLRNKGDVGGKVSENVSTSFTIWAANVRRIISCIVLDLWSTTRPLLFEMRSINGMEGILG